MSHGEPARIAAGRVRSTVLATVVLVSATLIGVVSWQAGDSSQDGVLASGVTVVDASPAVTNLHPDLRGALRQAAKAARRQRVEIVINSGWRSARYQQRLLHEAVSKYGSEERAARWVATAETSAHVSGDAVDIGGPEARAWLSRHGARYGLCQIYKNEPWHYERRPKAVNAGCPRMFINPTHDPRTQ